MNEGMFYCLSRQTVRKSRLILRIFALWLVLICPVFSSDAQINPIHGLPPKPQTEPLPKECSNSPEQTIGQIDTGMGIIGGCGVTKIFPRAHKQCCSKAEESSRNGCSKVLETAMNCCKLSLPIWLRMLPVSDSICGRALASYGVNEAIEYCWSRRTEELSRAGCKSQAVENRGPSGVF